MHKLAVSCAFIFRFLFIYSLQFIVVAVVGGGGGGGNGGYYSCFVTEWRCWLFDAGVLVRRLSKHKSRRRIWHFGNVEKVGSVTFLTVL